MLLTLRPTDYGPERPWPERKKGVVFLLRITVPRLFTADPLADIAQATRQAVACQLVLEYAHPFRPEYLRSRYEKADGEDRIDLIVEASDQERLGFLLKRLAAHGYVGFAPAHSAAKPPRRTY